MPFEFKYLDRISAISATDWARISASDYPFTSHQFLTALEQSGSVCDKTGWLPNHLLIYNDEKLIGAMPGYLKSHSYGEYVFDWRWAGAYEQHGLDYYPKQLFAIPFTPVSGPRLLLDRDFSNQDLLPELNRFLRASASEKGLSGWHMLFLEDEITAQLTQCGNLRRRDVQFEWNNSEHTIFDDFLGTLRSAKRKQIRKERRRVAEQGLTLQRKVGADIQPKDWLFFYRCYQHTYAKRSGHGGYLNQRFFERISKTMADQVMLVIATANQERSGEPVPIASALFFFDNNALYGRYWGTLLELDCLHFETCYYQGIEFAIERGLERFNPGTQGEHKLARGFEPTYTNSVHWLAQPQFHKAIGDYLDNEETTIKRYFQECLTRAAYRQEPEDAQSSNVS